jgi:hypothetical protein
MVGIQNFFNKILPNVIRSDDQWQLLLFAIGKSNRSFMMCGMSSEAWYVGKMLG